MQKAKYNQKDRSLSLSLSPPSPPSPPLLTVLKKQELRIGLRLEVGMGRAGRSLVGGGKARKAAGTPELAISSYHAPCHELKQHCISTWEQDGVVGEHRGAPCLSGAAGTEVLRTRTEVSQK